MSIDDRNWSVTDTQTTPTYISREAAKKIFCKKCIWLDEGVEQAKEICLSCKHPLDTIPPADVRPVVLCKDCKYHTAYRCPNDTRIWTHICALGHGTYGDDWFCADGERRTDE